MLIVNVKKEVVGIEIDRKNLGQPIKKLGVIHQNTVHYLKLLGSVMNCVRDLGVPRRPLW